MSEGPQQEDAHAAVHPGDQGGDQGAGLAEDDRAGGHQRIHALGAGRRSRCAFSRERRESAVASSTAAITARTIGAATGTLGSVPSAFHSRAPAQDSTPATSEDARPGH